LRLAAGDNSIDDESIVVELASRSSVVFVPAFDGDGFLLWLRTRLDAGDFVDTHV